VKWDLRHGNTENLLIATDCGVDVSDLTAVDRPQMKVRPSARSNVTLAHTISLWLHQCAVVINTSHNVDQCKLTTEMQDNYTDVELQPEKYPWDTDTKLQRFYLTFSSILVKIPPVSWCNLIHQKTARILTGMDETGR